MAVDHSALSPASARQDQTAGCRRKPHPQVKLGTLFKDITRSNRCSGVGPEEIECHPDVSLHFPLLNLAQKAIVEIATSGWKGIPTEIINRNRHSNSIYAAIHFD